MDHAFFFLSWTGSHSVSLSRWDLTCHRLVHLLTLFLSFFEHLRSLRERTFRHSRRFPSFSPLRKPQPLSPLRGTVWLFSTDFFAKPNTPGLRGFYDDWPMFFWLVVATYIMSHGIIAGVQNYLSSIFTSTFCWTRPFAFILTRHWYSDHLVWLKFPFTERWTETETGTGTLPSFHILNSLSPRSSFFNPSLVYHSYSSSSSSL